ncbi:50S ribosomal protein L1 [Candidatus Bathyarchaeota archaeon]|nr:MAG: 50S ribosomal protein L1 [Candidatus Bathyarchaeota archaeon ex4484_40]RJS79732.1 MAG: 50S ribosomal protein L1 [Candidatus Bathyarchaeota archaeon]RLG98489.1 MAG: 50S ribosomal protein L1 [Candidatus Bathyarchaeota archaeon]
MPGEIDRFKEALKEMRKASKKRNFTQSVELIINLTDVDVRKPENRIQETIELPHPINKTIGVFATGDLALRARKCGVDLVLEREEIEGLLNDKKRQRKIAKAIDFFIAEAPLMPLIGRVFGSILGPRGKMPRPIPPTADIEREVENLRRMVFVRTRGQPVIQCKIGTEDMPDEQIAENALAVLRRIESRLKRGIKNIKSVYLKTTMGKAVKVNLQ